MKQLLLVIPFHNGDRGQVERLGKWMTALSGGKKIASQALFSATVHAEIAGIGDNFKGLFAEMKAIRQTFGPNLEHNENPWPKACNLQFLHTAKHIYDHYPEIDAFYYFEPDNLPLTPDWLDRITADYEKQGKPFYGATSSYIERREGVDAYIDGEHMIGTGIYPRDAWARIKGYAKLEHEQPGRPWDALTRDEVNPQCHFTNLICHAHSSRGFMGKGGELTAVYRPNLEREFGRRPVNIPGEAVIFHGCKDSSLRLLVAEKLGIPQKDELTFAHAGDLGDVIYALPAIKARGGGILKLVTKPYTREPMTVERMRLIAPLLLEQPYIHGVEMGDGGYVDFDLCLFRNLHKKHTNLAENQAKWIGASVDLSKPWLTVQGVKKNGHVVINRTERYHNELFPWATIYKQLGPHIRFIGLEDELVDFQADYGLAMSLETEDLLEAARLIAGSHTFIGNQSVCFAIAEGLKHNRIQETFVDNRDCLFPANTKACYCDTDALILPELAPPPKERSSEKTILDQLLDDPRFQIKVNRLIDLKLEEILK